MVAAAADNPDDKPPADHAASPLNGVVPPVKHRWPPGQSGNPSGRPAAGATLREWLNVLAAQDLTERQIRAIARDTALPWTKRAAAERILRTLENGDVADIEPVLKGTKTLDDLRKEGVNTEMVKKLSITEKGISVEMHDRSGVDFDRITETTDGRPTQRVDVKHDGTLRTNADGQAAADAAVAALQAAVGT